MKFISAIFVIGLVIYFWVKFIRFVGAILKVITTQKPLPTTPVSRQNMPKKPPAVSYPVREVRPEVVASEVFDEETESAESSIDRSFEEMGLELRFAHLPKAAKQMLKKAWTGRKISESDEEPAIIKDGVRETKESDQALSESFKPFSNDYFRLLQPDDLQKAFVFSEILAPPIALREE